MDRRHTKGRVHWLVRSVLAVLISVPAAAAVTVATAGPAAADGCYTWSGALQQGASGEPVRQLQIRLAGWVDRGEVLAVDGNFGPRTKAAVMKFQAAYGLQVDGSAGPQTQSKLYELQDDDCTPIHFTYPELDCGTNYTGSSKVSQATAKARTLQVMWQLEALRHKLGDRPININSGFRSDSCNSRAGGASNSPHLYGLAADLDESPHSLCTLYNAAVGSGFNRVLGPGYKDGNHNDHIHVDNSNILGWSKEYSAPSC